MIEVSIDFRVHAFKHKLKTVVAFPLPVVRTAPTIVAFHNGRARSIYTVRPFFRTTNPLRGLRIDVS